MMQNTILAAITAHGCAMSLDTRSNTFLSLQSQTSEEDTFQSTSGVSVELHETLQSLAMDLLAVNPTEGMPSVRDGMKAISHRMDLNTALKSIKHKDLPSDVQSFITTSADTTHKGGFDEASMGKARVALNSLVEKAWVTLDDKIIECKEYQEMNRGTFDQVVTDVSRLVEQITDLSRVESESEKGEQQMSDEIQSVEDDISKETKLYNTIFQTNNAQLTTRQNDLDVFAEILQITRCPDGTSLLQSNVSESRICSIQGGERTMCFNDHHAQTRFNQMISHSSKHAISQILSEVDAPAFHRDEQMESFLQFSQEPFPPGAATQVVAEVIGDNPAPKDFVPAPFCCEAHGVSCSPQGGGIMCSPEPPDCGLLHDKMSLMWGDFKDQVDELTMEMNKNAYMFEELKITLNDQIQILTNSKARFSMLLSEARSNLAADRSEKSEKEQQKSELEKAFINFMKKCCNRVKWIMFQDMCALIVVRNSVLEGSTECPGLSIVDCDVANWVPAKCSVQCDDTCVAMPSASEVYECGGWQTVNRAVVVNPPDLDREGGPCGLQCPPLTRTKKCNQKKCPVDCVMSEWSGWSKCTAECEGGTRGQTRSIMEKSLNGGVSCNTNQESEPCNTMSCDRDCKLAGWTPWAPCSVACGGGLQTRLKHVLIPTRGQGKCASEQSKMRLAEQECNTHDCIGDEICVAEQDLIIAIDGSGSLRENGFGIVKSFAVTLLSRYQSQYNGKEKMKIGLIEFGNGIIMGDGVSISPAMNVHPLSTDLTAVKSALEGTVQKKGFTNMAQAFALAETMYTSAGRSGAQPALLTITDGLPSFAFQTQELAEQLDDKGVQRFFVVVGGDKQRVKEMTRYASSPWETNLLHIPDTFALDNDDGAWAEKALTLFCPMSISPSLETHQEIQVGFIHVLDSAYCGGRGALLSTTVTSADGCAALAQGAGAQSFLLGVWFRRGYCFAGLQTVDEAQFSTLLTSKRAAPDVICGEGNARTESMIYDWYAVAPIMD